jgi:hypothetical protein
MYIGVAINATTIQIHQQIITNPDFKVIEQKSPTSGSEAILFQIDSLRYGYHYLKQLKQGDKYLFSVTANSKALPEKMYNSSFIEDSFVNE